MPARPGETPSLLEQATRGDEEAFRRLLELHARTIEATLVAHGVRTRDLAQDLTQEIALRLWRNLEKVRDPARFEAWLRQVAANAARDHWRRLAARREDSLESTELPVAADDPAALAMRRAEVRQMADALAGEPAEVVSLLAARADGVSVETLASRAGISAAALKMRLSRARERLRRRFTALSGDSGEPPEP